MELETKFYVPDFIVGGLRSGKMVPKWWCNSMGKRDGTCW